MNKRVIIIECDPQKLKQDQLNFAEELTDFLERPLGTSSVLSWMSSKILSNPFSYHHIPISSIEDLEVGLTALRREQGHRNTLNIVVLVGHSNESGIQVGGSSGFVSWDRFAMHTRQVEADALILVACRGGNWLPAQQCFKNIPSLKSLYGAPLNLTLEQANNLKYLIYLLTNGEPEPLIEFGMGYLQFKATNGIILKYTRAGYENNDSFEFWQGKIVQILNH